MKAKVRSLTAFFPHVVDFILVHRLKVLSRVKGLSPPLPHPYPLGPKIVRGTSCRSFLQRLPRLASVWRKNRLYSLGYIPDPFSFAQTFVSFSPRFWYLVKIFSLLPADVHCLNVSASSPPSFPLTRELRYTCPLALPHAGPLVPPSLHSDHPPTATCAGKEQCRPLCPWLMNVPII